MPYGRPTAPGVTLEYGPGVREAFRQGAFTEAIAALEERPVPILDRHDGQVIGVARELEDRPEGLWFRGRLFDSDAARSWAQQVAEGVNGVSIEFAVGRTARRARDLVEHTAAAAIGAIAATYKPAYQGAAVSIRQEERPMAELELEEGAPTGAAHTEHPGVTAGTIPLTQERMAALARTIAEDVLRTHLEAGAGQGVDPWARYRGMTLGELMSSVALDPASRDLRGYASRALADQLTTDNNAGVTSPSSISEVAGIIDNGRPAINAFGPPRPLGAQGMNVTWPYFDGTLSSLVAAQATQKTEITSVKVEIKQGTEPILTFAGGSDIAYQLIRRSDPAYLDVYGRILLAAYALVTDKAMCTELESGGQNVDTGVVTSLTADTMKGFLIDAAIQVQVATGAPAEFAIAGQQFFTQAAKVLNPAPVYNAPGTMNLRRLEVSIGGLPIILDTNVTTGKAIVSNSLAARWHEEGPFQATDEDVAKLGRDVAYWGMGACARYIPAGIVEVFDAP